jgi:phosphatidylglycerophosphatase A
MRFPISCHGWLRSPPQDPNLARVDASMGLHYFAGMYGRASDVLGAMPSLHVAYALLVAVEGWGLMSHLWRVASGGVLVAAIATTFVGVWASSAVSRELGKKDPPLVVVDEVAGLLVTMLPVHHFSWRAMVLGLLCFRALDIAKPWPVRRLERLPAGWGIVLDDVAAGILGACIMFGLRDLRIF